MDRLGSRFGGPIVLVTFLARAARPRIASLVDLQQMNQSVRSPG
jgi:hypothetical protein